jgi:glycosyltransferase involved in cell wall biosynthesis
MKIVYFHQYFSTPSGAAGIRSYEMARRLAARGHRVLMVCGSAERGQTGLEMPFVRGQRRGMIPAGIEVLEFDLRYSNRDSFVKRTAAFVSFAARSVSVALTEPSDLIFATTTPLTAGIPGVVARWMRRKRFVFEVRDLWPELPRAMGVIRNPLILWAMSVLEWISYRSAHTLIGLSPGIVDGIAKRGTPRSRIALVPNGCDLDIFNERAHAWRPAEVKPTDLMAVFAGAHGIANGLDELLDAADSLKARGRDDVKIVLVGEGKLKPELQRRAAADRLSNVIFHDAVSKAKLAGLMASADVGLQILADVPAFYYGTSPNKFFDYIAAGLPVLINYPGWLAELVHEHQCGYAVPAGDPEKLADALIHAADHRSELPSMGARALALAKRDFDRSILAERFSEWLEWSVAC